MATKTIRTCDRCNTDNVATSITYNASGRYHDLCKECARQLHAWLSSDNATRPGDRVGWRERCTHHVPCAGPCGSGVYERV